MAHCLQKPESQWSDAVGEAQALRPDLAAPLAGLFDQVRALDHVFQLDAHAQPSGASIGGYQLLERVGTGGMGVVYRARHQRDDRVVALKLIRPEYLMQARSKERFRREAEAISRLNHPGIVPMLDTGEDRGVPFLAMEFIEGQSLGRLIEAARFSAPAKLRGSDLARAYRQGAGPAFTGAEGVFAPMEREGWAATCCRVVARVARALHHAHENGVIHRDVKPSNIMVTPDGRVIVVDFGLARAEGDATLTHTGSHPGSLPYMSPEQLAGSAVDARSDVYALGVTLHEMLTLRCPFPFRDAAETRRLIAAGSCPRLRARNRAVSPAIEAVCLKAMERDAGHRYPTAAAFADDLVNAVFDRTINAAMFGPVRRATRLARRYPARTLAALALFLALVISPVLLVVQHRRHDAALREEAALRQDICRRAAEVQAEATGLSAYLHRLINGNGAPVRPDLTMGEALEQAAGSADQWLSASPAARVRVLTLMAGWWCRLGEHERARPLVETASALAGTAFGADDPRLLPVFILASEVAPDASRRGRHARDAAALAGRAPDCPPLDASYAYGVLSDVLVAEGADQRGAEDAARRALLWADRARQKADHPEAAGHAQRARLDAWAKLVTLVAARGAALEALVMGNAELNRALAECDSRDPRPLELLAALAAVATHVRDAEGVVRHCAEARKRAVAAFGADSVWLPRIRLLEYGAMVLRGETPQLSSVEADIARLASAFGRDSVQLTRGSIARVVALMGARRWQEAADASTVLLEGLRGPDGYRDVCAAQALLFHRARGRAEVGALESAASDARELLSIAREHSSPFYAAVATTLLSACHRRSGAWEAAEAVIRDGMRDLAQWATSDRALVASLRQELARILQEAGRLPEARVALQEYVLFLGDVDDHVMRHQRLGAGVQLGELAYLTGSFNEARRHWDAFTAAGHDAADACHVADVCLRLIALAWIEQEPRTRLDGLRDTLRANRDAACDKAQPLLDVFLAALDGGLSPHEKPLAFLKALSRAYEQFSIGGHALVESTALVGVRAALDRGEFATAETLAAECLAFTAKRKLRVAWIEARLRLLLARAMVRQDGYQQAKDLVEAVEATVEELQGEAYGEVLTDLRLAHEDLKKFGP